ncbi:MAG: HAMP domain-containing histidine kinase [Lachnospiraceae bacterium]|nr:HAMP domain-containing histidine kinase [Lachnospiraceae bacterium]
MKIRKIAAVFTVLMLVFLYFLTRLYFRADSPTRDIVYYNDLLNRIEEELSAGKDRALIEEEYGCVIVLDKKLHNPDLAELYADEAFVLDLSVDGEYVGKVAWRDRQEERNSYRNAVLRTSLIIWISVLLGGYIFLLVIYLTYIRPSDALKGFSEELAKGNLDTPIPMSRSRLFGSFSEAFDIMREELKTSRKRRIEAEISRKELVSSLSHDVKTPVAVIDATCEVLDVKLNRNLSELKERGASSGDLAEIRDLIEKIGTIRAKAETINTLTADLIRSSQEESEKVEIRTREEFSSAIEDYLIRIRSYGRIVLTGHIPRCLVYMDRRRMEQVLDNIIGNSVKYAGTDIRVSFDEVKDILMPGGSTGNFIRITISDSGPGVSEEDLPLIAQKYYRGSNAGEKSGYGMGLYLVKQYMLKMGGDMEYYNDNGFTVVLMLKKV